MHKPFCTRGGRRHNWFFSSFSDALERNKAEQWARQVGPNTFDGANAQHFRRGSGKRSRRRLFRSRCLYSDGISWVPVRVCHAFIEMHGPLLLLLFGVDCVLLAWRYWPRRNWPLFFILSALKVNGPDHFSVHTGRSNY